MYCMQYEIKCISKEYKLWRILQRLDSDWNEIEKWTILTNHECARMTKASRGMDGNDRTRGKQKNRFVEIKFWSIGSDRGAQ